LPIADHLISILIVRSADQLSDLTARATIRESALELFAERGYAGTSVRDIASAAGVSPALLFHHYGSKAGLRGAVEEWLMGLVASAVAGGATRADASAEAVLTERFRRFAAVGAEHPAVADYIARVLGEGGDAARELFDRMVATTRAELEGLEARGIVRATEDETGRALLLLFLELGPMLLRPQVERHMGGPLFEPAMVERWVAACTSLLAEGVIER
jgi:TetR/AcrR family transcriptional regulator, regulator of cefoperazone and chloramphenicol sensitivity